VPCGRQRRWRTVVAIACSPWDLVRRLPTQVMAASSRHRCCYPEGAGGWHRHPARGTVRATACSAGRR
jgi:hypothetical protein